MNRENIKKFIKKNKWIIFASVFFIIWKFFLIGVMWHDRISPPEPDDSYIYTGYINSVKVCPNFLCNYPDITFKKYSGFTYLSYRIFFGSTAKIFNFDPIKIFHASFYFGILLLIPILIFFISRFTKNKNIVAFSLFFLAIYNGSGSYHGFFWVVPSFFAVILFFWIFSILLSEKKKWKISLLFLVPIFIFMHDISIYSVAIYIFYAFLTFILNKKINWIILKKIVFILLLSIIFNFFMREIIHSFHNTNPKDIQSSFQKVEKNISIIKKLPAKNIKKITNKIFPGYPEFKNSYLLWIFPNTMGIIFFLIVLFFLIKYRQIQIISLYFSALVFSLVSLLNNYGFRSLAILWPITFIFYAWGFWHILKFIKENKFKFSGIIEISFFVCLFSFITLNLFYSYAFSKYINERNDINIPKNISVYIAKNINKNKCVYYNSKLLHSYALNTSLINNNTCPLKDADYALIYEKNDVLKQPKEIDSFFNVLSKILNKNRSVATNPQNSKTDLSDFSLEKIFGNIKIYKNKR